MENKELIKEMVLEIGKKARKAGRALAALDTEKKNKALNAMAYELELNAAQIESENAKDIENARKEKMDAALIDRLLLDNERVKSMAGGVRDIISLSDPVGEVYDETERPNGLKVSRMRIPIGVIGIIYESRPNVTADTSALCLKTGNAVILRGGKEAFNTNRAIVSILRDALEKAGITPDAVQFIDTTDREAVLHMLKMNEYIDVIIPRGGPGLIKFVSEKSTIPVIKHDAGVCHVYIDEEADYNTARDITINSKCHRPGVCNAAETLLIHSSWADNVPRLLDELEKAGVEIRACAKTYEIYSHAKPATENDWYAEYLTLILAVKIVDSMEEAIDHIETYGSQHTETIVTPSPEQGEAFIKAVDSSAVMVNTSTRFNDGGQFGLGAEMGISTQKLHCRGPMGLKELTIYKFVVHGKGQIRS